MTTMPDKRGWGALRARWPAVLLAVCLVGCATGRGVDRGAWSAAERERVASSFGALVGELASPAMQGRGMGTPGLERARDLVAARLASAGGLPAFVADDGSASYTQRFEVRGPAEASTARLALLAPGGSAEALEPGTASDFTALGFSADGAFDGGAVFVGYGIDDPDRGYDSYGGRDIAGRVVIAFRYEPMDAGGSSLWAEAGGGGRGPWSPAAALTAKAGWAARHGAVALVLIDPPKRSGAGGPLRSTAATGALQPRSPIPVLHAHRSVLERALRAAGRDPASAIDAYQRRADDLVFDHRPDELAGVRLAGAAAIERPVHTADNVGAVFPGSGELRDQFVVVGAHYDHLGMGEVGSLGGAGRVHPGADDNASGTAAAVLLAERLGGVLGGVTPRRGVVVVAFSAEERGLLGSRHLVEHPDRFAPALDRVVAMVNLDMVGRLRDRTLYAYGTGSGSGWEAVLAGAAAGLRVEPVTGSGGGGDAAGGGGGAGLRLETGPRTGALSDHAAFVARGIPAVHLFTGLHEQYHRPTDTADRISTAGGAAVVELLERLVVALATDREPMTFVAPGQRPRAEPMAPAR